MQEIEEHKVIFSQASLTKSLAKDDIAKLVAEISAEEKKLGALLEKGSTHQIKFSKSAS